MDTRREEIAATFDLRARGYRDSDWHRASAGQLVDLCGLKPGNRVLDAGTGTGFAALHAARQVGEQGRVVGVDISQGMLSEARAEAAASSLANIEFIQCDATALAQFPDAAFDVVTSATSLIYIPVVEGLLEWHRLLRHGRPDRLLDDAGRFPGGGAPVPRVRRRVPRFGSRIRARHWDPMAPAGKPSPPPGSSTPKLSQRAVQFSVRDMERAWESNLRSLAHKARPGSPGRVALGAAAAVSSRSCR